MAPEVHAGAQAAIASDIFSLHVVVWEVSDRDTKVVVVRESLELLLSAASPKQALAHACSYDFAPCNLLVPASPDSNGEGGWTRFSDWRAAASFAGFQASRWWQRSACTARRNTGTLGCVRACRPQATAAHGGSASGGARCHARPGTSERLFDGPRCSDGAVRGHQRRIMEEQLGLGDVSSARRMARRYCGQRRPGGEARSARQQLGRWGKRFFFAAW